MKTQIDHLVVAASSLEQGLQWCEATLGVTPNPGGEHEKFGTHNRLIKIATPQHPLAYLEIIAINPQAVRPKSRAARWFDLDDVQLQKAIAQEPRLIHFVASSDEIKAARHALLRQDIERGQIVHASRASSKGVVHWQITVREDGQRLFNGCLPTLIQWGKPDATEPLRLHPRNTLPRSKVSLHSLSISHPNPQKLEEAYAAIGLSGVEIVQGPANLLARLHTPKGLVELQSLGL